MKKLSQRQALRHAMESCFGAFGGFAIPLLLGSLAGHENGYTRVFVIFIVLAAASLALLKTLKRHPTPRLEA